MAIPALTNNSPVAGSIAWGAFNIQYNGVGYSISAGSTSERWTWWRYNGGSSVIEAGPTIPDGAVTNLTRNSGMTVPEFNDLTLPRYWLRAVAGNSGYGALHTAAIDSTEGALKMVTGQTGATGPTIGQVVDLVPGSTIQVTYTAKGDVVQNALTVRLVPTVAGAPVTATFNMGVIANGMDTVYKTFTGTLVVPAGLTQARMVLSSLSKAVGNTVWLKDVTLWAQVPAALTDDDLLLFGNKNGFGVRVQSTSFVDGELLVDGTVFASAIAANAIQTEHMRAGTIDGDRIKAGTLESDRVIVGGGNGTPLRTQAAADAAAYAQSRATDLVANGTGFLNNNQNFSGFAFVPTDAPSGANGSFTTSTPTATKFVDENIPINPSKTYKLSVAARQTIPGIAANMYTGLAPVDSAGLVISPIHYARMAGSTTTLAQPLNPGDTTVTLTSSAGWYNGAATASKYLQFWDYVDSFGKAWPIETYTRNITAADMWASGGIAGNVITLRVPWAGAAKAAGTPLSNGISGGAYMYGGWNNNTPDSTWQTKSQIYTGTNNTGAVSTAALGFPPGTAAVNIVFLLNRDVAGGIHAVANVSFSDASAAFERWAPTGVTTIDGGKITADTVTALQIATETITALEILGDTITANEIATGAITANEIQADAVTTIKILAEAITAEKILGRTITADKIASGTITANEIFGGTITADKIAAGTIGAAQINASEIAAMFIKAGLIEAASAVISASLRTGDIQIDGGMQVNGVTNTINGQLNLTSGVSTPPKPAVTTTWPYNSFPAVTASDYEFGEIKSFTLSDLGYYVTVETGELVSTGVAANKIRFWDSTRSSSTTVDLPNPSANADPVAVTKLGTNYYVLLWDNNLTTSNVWIAIVSDTTKTVTATHQLRNSADVPYSSVYQPYLANDGTNLKFAASGGTWNRIYTYDPANLGTTPGHGYLSVMDVNGAATYKRNYYGLYFGNGDYGTPKIIAIMSTTAGGVTAAPISFDPTTGAAISGETWRMPFDWSDATGIQYRNGYFWQGFGAFVAQMSDQKTAQPYLDFATSWWDSVNPTHETPIGPVTNVSVSARQWVNVSWGAIPAGYGALGPNSARVYSRTSGGGTWFRQVAPGVGWTNITYAVLLAGAGTGPVAAPGGFAGLAGLSPGLIVSSKADNVSPIINLKGDGPGRAGFASWDANGMATQCVSIGRSATFTPAVNWLALTTYTSVLHGDASMANLTTGIITVPVDGIYQIEAGGVLGPATSSRRIIAIDDYTASSTAGSSILARAGGTSVSEEPAIVRRVFLAAGRQLRASYFSNNTTTTIGSDSGLYFTVSRVG